MTENQGFVAEVLTAVIDRDLSYLSAVIDEGLPDTAGDIARWIAQVAFEVRPDLRGNDIGMRYMARPIACAN